MDSKRDPVLWSGQRCLIGSIGRRLLTVRHQSWGFDLLGGWAPWLGVCFIMSIHQGSSWIGMNRTNRITGSKSIRNGFQIHNLAQSGVLVLGMISCISSIIFGNMKPCKITGCRVSWVVGFRSGSSFGWEKKRTTIRGIWYSHEIH